MLSLSVKYDFQPQKTKNILNFPQICIAFGTQV